MNELQYTITEFDPTLKRVKVVFGDGSWAALQLTVPLPKDITDLEAIIKQFSAPIEAIQAQQAPDADLSYITSLIGQPQTCERLSNSKKPESQALDPDVLAEIQKAEEAAFEASVIGVLQKQGILPV